MNIDEIYLLEMFKKFDIRINIFDEGGKSEITSKVVGNIIQTKNNDFISFCLFYFFLYHQRLVNATDNQHVITSDEIWPYINSSRSIIQRYLDTGNDEEYKNMIHYLKNEFKPKLKNYLDELKKEHRLLKNKISAEKKVIIDTNYKKEIIVLQAELKYGIELNEIAGMMHQINVLKEKSDEIKMLIQDEKRYKFHYRLALGLAIASIVLTILTYCFPRT